MSDREDMRRMVQELLREALANGDGPEVTVPPPPVAAVLRPSNWNRPPAPGEVIGDGTAAAAEDAAGAVEPVRIDSDADLDRFVRALLARAGRDGPAILAGRLRFTLGRAAAPSGVTRVERGAVTERAVKDAAAAGGRLVLGPGAVMTPLAREKARAVGIEIERER